MSRIGRRRRMRVAAFVGALAAGCGDSSSPTEPNQVQESWYIFPVMCSNCPGLTNVEIDRTVRPFLARLAVGELTSVRAVAIEGCGTEQPMLQIVRWIVSDSSVIAVEPSSPESAIVTALNPGRSRLVAERMLPEGGLGQVGLRDPFLESSQCTMLPELVFEIVPENLAAPFRVSGMD